MNEAIAAFHRIDPASVGLADYGKPGNYFARQTSRWSRQYLEIPKLDATRTWTGSWRSFGAVTKTRPSAAS
jgi:aminoglycoside phosphotransferase (APT) family kinase protein